MTDVSKIHGPTGPSQEPGKKEKTSVDADKFKEAMHKRVEEVSQVDPDEQKKRKRQEEAEAESEALPSAPTPPPEPTTPFSSEAQTGTTEKGPTIPPIQTSQTTPSQTPQTPWTPEGQQPVTPGPPESSPKRKELKPSETHKPPETKKEPLPPPPPKTPPLRQEAPTEKKPAGQTAAELEATQLSQKEDTTGFFEKMGKKEKPEIKTASEEEAVWEEEGGAPQPTGPKAKEEGKEKEKISSTGEISGLITTPVELPPATPPGPQPLSPYLTLHPRVQELFDRMVGVMTVMHMSGVTETTITLNSPQFASSLFFGAQITIQEFATAPKAFNIQLNANPEAIALFQGNAQDLMAAFQAGNYTFRINRLETGYLAERPLFRRKEGAAGDKQDQKGDSRQ
jgi:hypothetical protein